MTTPADIGAFRDLQDLTQATDAQLESMLVFGCKEGIVANYEDAITEHLLRVFRHITGVPWIRGFEQGARPDQQYGTIWLLGAKSVSAHETEYLKVIDGATMLPVDDLCEVSSQTFEYQFQLDVYKEGGIATRNQETVLKVGPKLSAFDVIIRLMTALGHYRFRSALAEKCIYLGAPAFGAVRNFAKPIIQNTFESRAGVDLFIRVRPISSIRSPTYGFVDWGFLCPTDAELFPDPPIPTIC